jgi:hypothetical protein
MNFLLVNGNGLYEAGESKNLVNTINNILSLYSGSFSRMLEKQTFTNTQLNKDKQEVPVEVIQRLNNFIDFTLDSTTTSKSLSIVNNFAFVGRDLVISSTLIALRDLLYACCLLRGMNNIKIKKFLMTVELYKNGTKFTNYSGQDLDIISYDKITEKQSHKTTGEILEKMNFSIHTENYWSYEIFTNNKNLLSDLLQMK